VTNDEELRQVALVSDRLVARHPEAPRDAIETAVHQVYARFAASTVRDFVPLLVERYAADRLAGTVAQHRTHGAR
jgi:hypothetical protein